MADLFSALHKPQNPYFAALLREGLSSAPIQSHTQGLSRMAHALLAGWEMNDQTGRDKEAQALRMNLPGLEQAAPQQSSMAPVAAPPETPNFQNAIVGIESGGKYDALGPVTKTGDRAHGKYQIMGANIGPWTQKFVGNAMTPEQFLANPQAQDQVFNSQFGEYAKKYGPEGAARAWFAGERGMNNPNAKDQLGTTVSGYAQKFNAALPPNAQPTSGPIPPQVAQMQPQQPAPPTAAPPQRSPVQIDPRMAAQIRAMIGSRDPSIQQQGYQLYMQFAKPREETRPLTDPAERARMGIQQTDTNPYQVDATGKVSPINPQPFNVNVNQQQESEFKKKAGALTAERFDSYVKGGDDAKSLIADINSLRDIGGRITTGKTAEITAALGPYAEALGVKIDTLPDLQAYNAIVAKLQPRMRVAGSGATSDYEMKTFLAALPSIGKTPEGNALIANTMDALQQHKIAAAEIASQAMAGEISATEAEKKIRALPDPMELWRKNKGKLPTAAEGNWQEVAPGIRIREKK